MTGQAKQADICGVTIRFDIPASIGEGIDGVNIHEQMIVELHDLPRCDETCCGHHAWVSFGYKDLEDAINNKPLDASYVQEVVSRFTSTKYKECCCFKCNELTEDNDSPNCGCESGPAFSDITEQKETCKSCPKNSFCDAAENPNAYLL